MSCCGAAAAAATVRKRGGIVEDPNARRDRSPRASKDRRAQGQGDAASAYVRRTLEELNLGRWLNGESIGSDGMSLPTKEHDMEGEEDSTEDVGLPDEFSGGTSIEMPVYALNVQSPPPPRKECNVGFVECNGGFQVVGGVTNTSMTCQAACALLVGPGEAKGCCDNGGGDDACVGYSGLVCGDGSCGGADQTSGDDACKDANIPTVISGCRFDNACKNAGTVGGFIGEVNNGCIGESSCEEVAMDYGYVKAIINSCISRENACFRMGGLNGTVGLVSNSCLDGGDDDVCIRLGYQYSEVGDVISSCWGEGACGDLGREYGVVGNLEESCWGQEVCETMADEYGKVGNVARSCRGHEACRRMASATGGKVGNVLDSCVGYKSCESIADDTNATVGDITGSCCGFEACQDLADDEDEFVAFLLDSCNNYRSCEDMKNITVGVSSCCNNADECEEADSNEDLPDVCGTDTPTSSPFVTESPTDQCFTENKMIDDLTKERDDLKKKLEECEGNNGMPPKPMPPKPTSFKECVHQFIKDVTGHELV